MAGLLEARKRAQLVHAPFDVGVPRLPVLGLCAVRAEHRIGHEQAGRLHVRDEYCVPVLRRDVPCKHDADLVGENLLAFVVNNATAVTVAIEAERDIRPYPQHLVTHGVQHLHVFGVGIVFWKIMVEVAVETNNLAAHGFEHLRRECPCRSVAACANHLEPALELWPPGEIGDVAGGKIRHEFVCAASAQVETRLEDDVLEPAHLVRTKGERPMGAHLHTGPAIVVVRGGYHRHARNIEIELGEIRHGGESKAYVANLASRGHEAADERGFHRGGVGAEIMAGDDLRPHAQFMDEGAKAHPERLHAHQIDFISKQPTCVVLAKPGGLHQRLGFIGIGVGFKRKFRLGKHRSSLNGRRAHAA
jgi:hypothetical protein